MASRRRRTAAARLDLEVDVPATRETISALCHRVAAALEVCDEAVVVCDLRTVTDPDMTVIDALARMQLTARRHGRALRLREACPALRDLLALAGLTEVLPVLPADTESTE
jgi:anti-anti-sigma regulatory factor